MRVNQQSLILVVRVAGDIITLTLLFSVKCSANLGASTWRGIGENRKSTVIVRDNCRPGAFMWGHLRAIEYFDGSDRFHHRLIRHGILRYRNVA